MEIIHRDASKSIPKGVEVLLDTEAIKARIAWLRNGENHGFTGLLRLNSPQWDELKRLVNEESKRDLPPLTPWTRPRTIVVHSAMTGNTREISVSS